VDSRSVDIDVDGLWNISKATVRDWLLACFLFTLLVPGTLGIASPLTLLIYPLFGFALVMLSKQTDARILMMLSGLAVVGSVGILFVSRIPSRLDLSLLFLVLGLLLHIESHRRLARASRAARAADHLRTAQILILMGGSAIWIPRPDTETAFLTAGVAVYGLVVMTGTFLALGYKSWRKELAQTDIAEPAADLSL
jgi:hypothetical protein